jgi:hypothetical protein
MDLLPLKEEAFIQHSSENADPLVGLMPPGSVIFPVDPLNVTALSVSPRNAPATE